MADNVVDAHRDAVDSDAVMPAGRKRNHQLGPDAISARDQHRRAHLARAIESYQRAKTTNPAEYMRARCLRGLRDRSEQRNQALLQRDIDARILVCHPRRHQIDFLFLATTDARNARVPSR